MCRISIKTFLEQHYRLRCHMVLEERPTILVVHTQKTQNTTVTVSTFPFNTCAAQQQHGELLKSPPRAKGLQQSTHVPSDLSTPVTKATGTILPVLQLLLFLHPPFSTWHYYCCKKNPPAKHLPGTSSPQISELHQSWWN